MNPFAARATSSRRSSITAAHTRATPRRGSDPGRLDPAAEHVGERVDDLAERRVTRTASMNAGIRLTSGSAASARTRARASCTAARVAFALHLVEPAALLLFDLGTDAQDRRRRLVVALEERR